MERGLSNLKLFFATKYLEILDESVTNIFVIKCFSGLTGSKGNTKAKGEEGTDYQIGEHMKYAEAALRGSLVSVAKGLMAYRIADGALNLQKLELRTLYKAMSLEGLPSVEGQVEDKSLCCLNLGLGWCESGTYCSSSFIKFWELDLILYE